MTSPSEERGGLKTYSHLAGERRLPSEYDVVTSRLHYHYARGGFEVKVPLEDWYQRYLHGTGLKCEDWEAFRDPRETTYTKYTSLQKEQETFVDGLVSSALETKHDSGLSKEWLSELEIYLGAVRYPWHGLQMAAAYLGQLAPSGRLTILFAFQSADEIRRIERAAQRILQLREGAERFAASGLGHWTQNPDWQPLRKCIERLLVTYDWSEALVGLNLCVKPAVDFLTLSAMRYRANRLGDSLLEGILGSFEKDARWQRAWTQSLLKSLLENQPRNAALIRALATRWLPEATQAVQPLLPQGYEPSQLSLALAEHLRACGVPR